MFTALLSLHKHSSLGKRFYEKQTNFDHLSGWIMQSFSQDNLRYSTFGHFVQSIDNLSRWVACRYFITGVKASTLMSIPFFQFESNRVWEDEDPSEVLTQGGSTMCTADAMLEASNAVCLITRADGFCGTGFVIKDHLIMTNNHVLPDEATCQTAKAEFFLADKKVEAYFDPDAFFITSPEPPKPKQIVDEAHLDYTIVALKRNYNLEEVFNKPIQMPNKVPSNIPYVFIFQHPRGGVKKFSLGDNTVQENDPLVIRYKTETEPGSSGSPGLYVSGLGLRLFALHHQGSYRKNLNQGVRISAIIADLKRKEVYEKLRMWAPSWRSGKELYLQGKAWDDKRDWERALPLLEEAANQGCKEAYFPLGLLLLKGKHTDEADSQAKKWFNMAAAIDVSRLESTKASNVIDPDLQCRLAWYMLLNVTIEGEKKNPVEMFSKAVQNNSELFKKEIDAYVNYVGNAPLTDKMQFELYKIAADFGHPQAQFYAGHKLMMGLGVKSDQRAGFELYKTAAENGDSFAQATVAMFYLCGTSSDNLLDKGISYLKGTQDITLVVPTNPELAYEFAQKSAIEGNNPFGHVALGSFYLKGNNVTAAYDCFFRAVDTAKVEGDGLLQEYFALAGSHFFSTYDIENAIHLFTVYAGLTSVEEIAQLRALLEAETRSFHGSSYYELKSRIRRISKSNSKP